MKRRRRQNGNERKMTWMRDEKTTVTVRERKDEGMSER